MLKNVKRKLFDFAKGRSNYEILVRKVTSNHPCMPTDEEMAKVAKLTFNKLALDIVFCVVMERILDGSSSLHVLKATKLLSYLLENGSNMVVICLKDSHPDEIKRVLRNKKTNGFLKYGSLMQENINRDLELWRKNIQKKLKDDENTCLSPCSFSNANSSTTSNKNIHFCTFSEPLDIKLDSVEKKQKGNINEIKQKTKVEKKKLMKL